MNEWVWPGLGTNWQETDKWRPSSARGRLPWAAFYALWRPCQINDGTGMVEGHARAASMGHSLTLALNSSSSTTIRSSLVAHTLLLHSSHHTRTPGASCMTRVALLRCPHAPRLRLQRYLACFCARTHTSDAATLKPARYHMSLLLVVWRRAYATLRRIPARLQR